MVDLVAAGVQETDWLDPWEMLRNIEVVGLPMMRSLVIDATIAYPTFRGDAMNARIGDSIAFAMQNSKTHWKSSPPRFSNSTMTPDARIALPSLHD